MFTALPFKLFFAFFFLFGCVSFHQNAVSHFRGSSNIYKSLLVLSTALGSLIIICLLVYYGWVTAWYWPIILFLLASIASAILFNWMFKSIPVLLMQIICFIWPVIAYYTFTIIRVLY